MTDASRDHPAASAPVVPGRRVGRPASQALVERRALSERMHRHPMAAGVEVTSETIAGVDCRVCTPPTPVGTIVELHGGGYRLGGARAWSAFGSRLAAACGAKVILPDYGLAPEQPFPNGLIDALGVLEIVCSEAAPGSVALMGDSAGGGLALACELAATGRGLNLSATVLLSPWLDLRNQAGTFDTRAATDLMFSREAANEAAQTYLQGWPATDPLASPLLGQFGAAPPTLVLVSGDEVLLQDSLSLSERLALAGREVEMHVWPGLPHVWPVLRPETPAAGRALELIAGFLRRHRVGDGG